LLGTPVPIGLLAAGTTNVLTLSLGLPRNALAAAEQYAAAPSFAAGKLPARPLDVGLCGDRPFLMMMSRGLDGRALASVPKWLKRKLGKAAVAYSALAEFVRRPEPTFPLRWDELQGAEKQDRASFVAVCNVRHYAGSFLLAPGASPFDRKLDMVSLNAHGRWPTARFGAAVLRGRAACSPNVRTAQLTNLILEGEGPVLLQVDGDPYTTTLPIKITLARERLLLLKT